MIIQHNLPAMNSRRAYKKNNSSLSKSLEKLSSGYRINRAGDDAAGLAVSEKMRSQICGMKQAIHNSQDGISLIQTFEGALGETVAIIHRAKTLADQMANGSYDDEVDRHAVEVEYLHLCDEVNQIADTDFNGICMLNGGAMADGITYLTDKGRWKLPDTLIFDEDSYISTFKKIEGFPDIKMSIKLDDSVKGITEDMELWQGIMALNGAKIRGNCINGIPIYSLTGLDDAWADKFTVTSDGCSGVISLTTEKSGTVTIGYIESTEFPHYASTKAWGMWDRRSSAVLTYETSLEGLMTANPTWTRDQCEKFTESYITSSAATEDERRNYLRWITTATDRQGTLVEDTVFDHDTDTPTYIWNVDGQEYRSEQGTNQQVPLYTQQEIDDNGWPQVYLSNTYFIYDDEDFRLGSSTFFYTGYASTGSHYYGTTQIAHGLSMTPYGGNEYMTNSALKDIWQQYGSVTVTLTYHKSAEAATVPDANATTAEKNSIYVANGIRGTWTDNYVNTTTGLSSSDFRISGRYNNISRDLYDYEGYQNTDIQDIMNGTLPAGVNDRYRSAEAGNLYWFYEDDGQLPEGFQLTISLTTPYRRVYQSYGDIFLTNSEHGSENPQYYGYGYMMEEYDEAHPELGGVDWQVAKHGESYIYDGVLASWVRESDGEAVNLEDEGVYLATDVASYLYSPVYEGMKITVYNPTMSGEDWIEAELDNGTREKMKVSIPNAYRNDISKLTFSDNLILQAGARAKDGVRFTFAYSSTGIGDLYADLDCTTKGLGLDDLSLSTQEDANFAIDRLDHALNKVSMVRSTFGAAQNRLEHKIDNLNNSVENLTSAESTIRDTDMAEEMMKFTKEQILSQASQAMLAQANSLPQAVLSLISG